MPFFHTFDRFGLWLRKTYANRPISDDLQRALQSTNAPIRRDAVASLIQLSVTSEQGKPQINAMLDELARYDPDDQVRHMAGTALGWNENLLNAISTAFHSSSPSARLDAVVTLRYFLTQGMNAEASLAREWLLRLSQHDDDKQVRQAADLALPTSERPKTSKYVAQDRRAERLEKGRSVEPSAQGLSRRALLWLIGLLIVGFVGAFSLSFQQGPSTQHQPASVACTPPKMVSVGGASVMYQSSSGSSETARFLIKMDGTFNHTIDRSGEVDSLNLASDEKHVVESRHEPVAPYFFIYSWIIDDYAQWNEQLLTHGKYPSWSPNMTQIAFFRFSGFDRSALYIMDADGSNIRLLRKTYFVSSSASWSPDGTQLVISTSDFGSRTQNLYIIDVENDTERVLIRSGLTAQYPAWSPDGTSIAYVSNDIYTMNLDGSDRRNLTNGRFQNISHVGWSQDSSRLAFLAYDFEGTQAIYVVDRDGSGLRTLYTPCPRP